MALDKLALIMSLINNGNGGNSVDLSDYYSKTETDQRITAKVAEIIADAPEDFDTLKELSDWINEHEDSAAAMNSAIAANTAAIAQKADKSTTYTKTETNNLLNDKVSKESGKGLSTNDFTNADKSKLDDLENYDDTDVKADVAELASQAVINKTTLGYQRKNLLKNTAVTATQSGVTFTVNEDKSVTVNGTATSSTWFKLSVDNKISAGRYKITSGIDGYGTAILVCISPTTTYVDRVLDSTQSSKELSSMDGLIYAIRVQSGYTFDNVTVYPMLLYADIVDETYEPYKPSVEERLAAIEEKPESETENTIYTVGETPIGTWVDGRTIYRRVLDYSDSPINVNYVTLEEEFKPEYIIKMDALGVDYTVNPHTRMYLYSTTSGISLRQLYYEKDTRLLYTEGSYPISYIILEYVKENDET